MADQAESNQRNSSGTRMMSVAPSTAAPEVYYPVIISPRDVTDTLSLPPFPALHREDSLYHFQIEEGWPAGPMEDH